MIDWDDISTVFLDMDGTLLDLNFDNQFWQEFVPRRYAHKHGIDLQSAKQMLKPRFKAMEGKIEWYCLDYWSDELGLDIEGLKREVSGLIKVLPHVIDFLGAIAKTGVRLVLLTNAHPKTLAIKLDKTRLHAFFHSIVCSHDIGFPKENPRFWPYLNRAEPFNCERTLIVDDSIAVLREARNYGIRNVVVVSKPDSTREALETHEFPAVCDLRSLIPVC